jgi:flagellar FliL protein
VAKEKPKEKDAKQASDKPAKPSLMAAILPVLLLTLIAGGGGFALGTLKEFHVKQDTPPVETKLSDGTAEKPAEGSSEKSAEPAPEPLPAKGAVVRKLAPIVTNLLKPKETWVRMELSVVIPADAAHDQDLISVEASDQIVALLRTVSLDELDGPSGFTHLREDINDQVTTLQKGKVSEVLVNSLVVE